MPVSFQVQTTNRVLHDNRKRAETGVGNLPARDERRASGTHYHHRQTDNFGDPGSCTTLTRIIVGPNHLRGVGNVAVNQDPCTRVAEPGSLALPGIGSLAFGLARRTRHA